ncbi:BolA family protein [Buchnera aphidicola]|uniref:Bola n=1 Tax=Buchnera aphidicola str. USDA (Myzus persicae) TaxID=1009856 RepID=W0NZM6_BUCMP|nr:BolA family protein [Buchnera aphidicola]AHG59924.1 Bola [Buchnera aphidicola str. USDA (Myzus persicae)]AHG60504.1 Bola [Buchnera aphidicola str. W106 (Myzus persicae)]AHG61077.1 Bola [Buchnera aphidicola str. G002 (Myzus persicae)]AHG61649.1 Bola [Buchnera aphidicola str. F009 (Myzus persicae)]WAI03389.1 MAG: BolA family transcriptional regulator [Buchnera aphidicola (Myzus persicae)]
MILKKIKKHLTDRINVHFIIINDNSLLHNYSKKGLTHLTITIISNDFIKQKLITRHRMIFSILSEIIKEKIYSMTLNTYTPIEWEYKKYKKNNISHCFKKNKS